MGTDPIDTLRAQLAGRTGAARTRPLAELGQALSNRYWRLGPGSPAAKPDLDGAIEAFDEAYGYLDAGDKIRAMVAFQLGWLLGARHTTHGGPQQDRDRAIPLLEEGLDGADLPSTMRGFALFVLGQLYCARAVQSMQSDDFSTALRSGAASPVSTMDADRAVDCLRRVLTGEQVTQQLMDMAQAMLTMAESMQTLLGALSRGPAGVDLGKMMQAMAAMQTIQQQFGHGFPPPAAGMPAPPPVFDAERLAALDPLDRPVAVVPGPEQPSPADPAGPPVRPAPVVADLGALRLACRQRLGDPADPTADPVAAMLALLRPGSPQPAGETVDELVELAASIVHGGGTDTTDHLCLAMALHLRARLDDGGWGDGSTGGDPRAAGESLLLAARTPAGEPPGVVAVLATLAALLDEQDPAGRVRDGLAECFAEVTEALRAVGAAALVYPQACEQADGTVLLDAATGQLRPAGGSLPRRVLVVGSEPLPPGDTIVSYVSSAAQLLRLSRRGNRPISADPVFVANPRGDRESATVDVLLLRRAFYPRSTGLGRTVEDVDGAGTPDEVAAKLGASMLHLGCGVDTDGGLELAGPARLGPEAITARAPADHPGGLAVLSTASEGFVPLADALLAAGFTGVIGWHRPVPEPVAGLMFFVLHSRLVDEGLPPAEAVRAVQDWMRDEDRKPLPYLPAGYAVALAGTDLTDAAYWAAMTHRGR